MPVWHLVPFLRSFPFLFPPFRFLYLSFIFIPRRSPPQLQLGSLGSAVSFLGGSGWSPADKRFLAHSELKITLCAQIIRYDLIHIGPVTYQYGISQKRSRCMVSSRPRKCRCGIPSHFQPSATDIHILQCD